MVLLVALRGLEKTPAARSIGNHLLPPIPGQGVNSQDTYPRYWPGVIAWFFVNNPAPSSAPGAPRITCK